MNRSARLKKMAWCLVGLAFFFSTVAYFFFPQSQQETFYMISALFLAMAALCAYSKGH